MVTFCVVRAGLDEGAAAGISALVQHQRADGGWGYNAEVPSDSDSTAWACAAFVAAGRSALPSVERARNYLLAHEIHGREVSAPMPYPTGLTALSAGRRPTFVAGARPTRA